MHKRLRLAKRVSPKATVHRALRLRRPRARPPPAGRRAGRLRAALDDVMAHPRLREIVDCLARMATAGFLEYYCDDRWSFDTTIAREVALAEDLESL